MYMYRVARQKQSERIKGISALCVVCILLFVMEYKELGFLLGKEFLKTGVKASISYCVPWLDYSQEVRKSKGVQEQLLTKLFPILGQGKKLLSYETEVESVLSYEQILVLEALDENEVEESSKTENIVYENVVEEIDNSVDEEYILLNSPPEVVAEKKQKVVNYSKEKLYEFDYLVQNFYRIDKTTTITGEQLDAKKMLNKDMTLTHDASTPQILIYHTHSQEGYVDSVAGDTSTTVVGVPG